MINVMKLKNYMMKKMGRPKGTNNKENICTLRMDDETLKRLEAYCRKMNMRKSDVMREAINQLIEDEKSE